MITNGDESGYRDGNNSENRDGRASSEKRMSGDGVVKKKRPRVGDVRTTSTRPAEYDNRDNRDRDAYGNNEYRNSSYGSYGGGREDRSSYQERRPYNSDGGNRSYNNDRRPNNGNYGGRPSYNNNNNDRRSSYNNGGDRRQQGGGNRFGGGGGYNNNRRPSRPQQQQPRDPDQKVIARAKRLIKPVKYKENLDPSTPLRLNKYLANAGVCSRREADSFITAGDVLVNGVVVSELGAKVTRGDKIMFQGKEVQLESKVYVLLNKPKNCVTTSDDPQNRKTVMDLVKNACTERIYPVGRLDRNTTGVLLLTNDGDLASKLMHPKFKKKKIYQVTLDKDVAIEDMQAIADGIMLDDGEIHADSIAYVAEDLLSEVGIEIHSGRNRVVRRIFESLGYQVTKLDRVYFSGLTKKNLPRGRWRYLTESEVNMLRMGSFE